MLMVDTNRFNQIIVVDSIPTGDGNTARRLFEDLEINAIAYAPTPAVHHVRVENGDQLIQFILECRQCSVKQDFMPMLHIECHGNEDGFELADGSFVDWAELKGPITELNIAMHLNLLITVAACTGGALAKVVRMSDRAPFWGLIGPTESLAAEDLEKAYRAFYLTLLSTHSPAKAMEALDVASKPGLFWRTTVQKLFETGWAVYKKEYCTDEAIEDRARRMRDRAMQLSIKPLPTIAELKGRLASHEPAAFERFRNTFFMCDLFPEHSGRFQVKYVR
jgi:hypothetical protein